MKKALITGFAGQDGSYLTELLLSKGYEVHGIVRRAAIEDTAHKLKNISHLVDKIKFHVASLENVLSLIKVVRDLVPDECYARWWQSNWSCMPMKGGSIARVSVL